ncbi:MAG TPA: hypothetical protein VGL34_25795 [Steroidobacteraceae bacterium]
MTIACHGCSDGSPNDGLLENWRRANPVLAESGEQPAADTDDASAFRVGDIFPEYQDLGSASSASTKARFSA